jgi:hypothetical protein
VNTTLTPPGVQHHAIPSKLGKRKQLRYAGFAVSCNTWQHPLSLAVSKSAIRFHSSALFLSLLQEKLREASADTSIGLTAGYYGRPHRPLAFAALLRTLACSYLQRQQGSLATGYWQSTMMEKRSRIEEYECPLRTSSSTLHPADRSATRR